MSETNGELRYFFVDEDDSIHRIPNARYYRIYNRTQPIALYAGKSLRFITAYVESDEEANEELVNVWFTRHQFDEQGLRDENGADRNLQGAMEGVSVFGKDDYLQELWEIEHHNPFCWTPTSELINRIRDAVRTKR